MSESWFDISASTVVNRPIAVCRDHFLDLEHHQAHGVHARVNYEILEPREGRIRARSTLSVLGLQLVDLVELYPNGEREVVQEFVEGKNAGGRLVVRFSPEGSKTRIDAEAHVPVRGFDRVLKPVIRFAFLRVLEGALREDVTDLEGRYRLA
jgi:hypothetical protein